MSSKEVVEATFVVFLIGILMLILKAIHVGWCWLWGFWTTGPSWWTTPNYFIFVGVWAIWVCLALSIFGPRDTSSPLSS